MHYHALATDYDGTLAVDGRVDDETIGALERLRASGRRLVLVTGRERDDLLRVFPRPELFDRIVAENGALLIRPAERETVALAEPPPDRFVEALRRHGVSPLSVGRVIVATWEPNEVVVLETIRELGLEHQVIFNKGAVMVLPPGVNKASGLRAALDDLNLSAHNVVGIGDAENDHAFLQLCGCAVAVANALPMLKERADIVTSGARSAGVVELVERLIASDLADLPRRPGRHAIRLGADADGRQVVLPTRGAQVLVAGSSGSGKSTLVRGLLERLAGQAYQFCVVDPEGDYHQLEDVVAVGDAEQPPVAVHAIEVLERPTENVVVNMLAVPMADRPAFFSDLLLRLQQLRGRTGRPHWLIVDEAHHMLPAKRQPDAAELPGEFAGIVLVTVHPEQVSKAALSAVGHLLTVGETPEATIRAFCERIGEVPPAVEREALSPGEALAWECRTGRRPIRFAVPEPRGERRRHVRKYAEGELGEDKSFYFRGPGGRLNLRAQNLELFIQLAAGVDDATWLHHLRSGDYSRWFREAIKDEELADEAARIEADGQADPVSSRERIRAAVERRYTGAA